MPIYIYLVSIVNSNNTSQFISKVSLQCIRVSSKSNIRVYFFWLTKGRFIIFFFLNLGIYYVSVL